MKIEKEKVFNWLMKEINKIEQKYLSLLEQKKLELEGVNVNILN